MIFSPPAKTLWNELLVILDKEIELLNRKRSELDCLTEVIVANNDRGMEKLLEQMEQTQQAQAETDIKLDALRKALANELQLPTEQVRLSSLIEQLEGDDRLAADYRRQQIVLLAEQLRRKHMETALLLMESSRINRLLLDSFFPQSQPVNTYDADGSQSWRPDTGLLDTEL